MNKDFDPMAGLFSNILRPQKDPSEWLEGMTNAAPGEALDSPLMPLETETGPVRRVRSPSPDFLPAPLLPYPFDGSDSDAQSDIRVLCSPTVGQDERRGAVKRLLLKYEARHGVPLSLHAFISLWWKAARQHVDISALNGFPRNNPDLPYRSASAFFPKLQRVVAFDFISVRDVPEHLMRETLEAAGVPVPPVEPKRRRKV